MLSWEYPPHVVGGMGKHVAELVPALMGRTAAGEPLDIDVVTIHHAKASKLEQFGDHVTIHRVMTPPLDPVDPFNSVVDGNLPLIDYASRLMDETPYDIIHAHDWLVAEAGIMLKLRHHVPLITTIHATERGRYHGHLLNEASKQIDHMEWRACFESWEVIVCSRYMAQEVHQFFGTPMDKIVIIPNGVSLSEIAQATPAERQAVRSEFATNGERLLFFVGRMVHEKGLQVLLEAMPLILEEYPDTRLLVAGKNSHTMRDVAARFGVEEQVNFLGYITNQQRDQIYQTVDAAVFPSIYEPFGIVALEAMANNCNVIASEVSGLAEVVHHEINGLTALPNNPESLAWAVDRLFSDPQGAEQRKARARQEVEALYNWERVAERTIEVYERVTAERKLVDW
jgi:glycosyltransferase involved in cell wall biosynthesis